MHEDDDEESASAGDGWRGALALARRGARPSAMTTVDHVRPVSVRRPRGGWRWTAAGTVAFPVLWALSALLVGSLGMHPVWGAVHVAVLGLAVCVGLGHRWAYTGVVVLGSAVFVDSVTNPGMLAAAGWVFGTLYLAIGVALLLASRRGASARS
ncbi:hypothetical protein [Quadrisphaera setariae]|nr:hypothetical protein [Quadrisphaera setariae]